MDKKFVRLVEDECDTALMDLGIVRPRRGTRYFEVAEDFLGWVGLNQGNHPDFLRINPFIGIHCVPIMELLERLEGQKYQKGRYATYAIHLGEICPDVDQFIFRADEGIVEEARRLAATIFDYGLPWMKEHARFESLVPLIESRFEMHGGYPERLAISYYLMGELEKSRNLIDSRKDTFFSDQENPVSIYQRFTSPFLKMLDEASTS